MGEEEKQFHEFCDLHHDLANHMQKATFMIELFRVAKKERDAYRIAIQKILEVIPPCKEDDDCPFCHANKLLSYREQI